MPGKTRLPKPFVKWAGGKEQLLKEIAQHFPKEEFNHYFEPFLGGGAVFFYLRREGFRGRAVLSDLNEELITAYQTIQTQVEDLIEELSSGQYKPDESTFYKIRKWDREPDWNKTDSVIRTARMIYLNKTCYNGLYRVNSKGQFNVPYGRYDKPKILDKENLYAVHQALSNATLVCEDFERAVTEAKARDFVYFDPPYDPLSTTSNFTSYTKGGFGEDEQKRLAEVFHQLSRSFVLESNSDTPLIRKLYDSPHFFITEVSAKRAISCDPEGRGAIIELLIRNYSETKRKTLKQKQLLS